MYIFTCESRQILHLCTISTLINMSFIFHILYNSVQCTVYTVHLHRLTEICVYPAPFASDLNLIRLTYDNFIYDMNNYSSTHSLSILIRPSSYMFICNYETDQSHSLLRYKWGDMEILKFITIIHS